MRWEDGPPVCHRVWGWPNSLVGAYLLPAPEALWSGEWGPWRRKLAQPGPRPIQPWRRELISRLSPACCHSSPPLPPSFLHSRPAQPQSTSAKCRAHAAAKPLEALGGACERGLTSAGPHVLSSSLLQGLRGGVGRAHLAACPDLGVLGELRGEVGWGDCFQAKRRWRNALRLESAPPQLPRCSLIITIPSRDLSYLGLLEQPGILASLP